MMERGIFEGVESLVSISDIEFGYTEVVRNRYKNKFKYRSIYYV
jgi:hypothetical protein